MPEVKIDNKDIIKDNDNHVDHKDAEYLKKILEKGRSPEDLKEIKNAVSGISDGVNSYVDIFKNLNLRDMKKQIISFQELYNGLLKLEGTGNTLIIFKNALDIMQNNIDNKESTENNKKSNQEILDTVYKNIDNRDLGQIYFNQDNNNVSSLVEYEKSSDNINIGLKFKSDSNYGNGEESINSITYKDQKLNISNNIDISKSIKDFVEKVGYIGATGAKYDVASDSYTYEGVNIPAGEIDSDKFTKAIGGVNTDINQNKVNKAAEEITDNQADIRAINNDMKYNKETDNFYYQGVNKPRLEIKDKITLKEWKDGMDQKDQTGLETKLDQLSGVNDKAAVSMQIANDLFGDNGESGRPQWNSLFDSFDMNNSNLKSVISSYTKQSLDNIKNISAVTSDGTGADSYLKGEKYLKIDLNNANKDSNNEDSVHIYFGKTTEVIHKARAEAYDVDGNFDFKDVADLKNKGSYLALEKILKTNKPEKLDKELFESILKQGPDSDGYCSVIADYVGSQNSLPLLQSYLNIVDKNSMSYLGSTKKIQSENLKKVIKCNEGIKFGADQESIKNDLLNTISDMVLQLQPTPLTMKQAFDKGVEGFFKVFGSQLIGLLEMVGGKGCVSKFFDKIGMGDWYKANMSVFDEQLDALYKKEYAMNPEQKQICSDMASKYEKKFDQKIIDGFVGPDGLKNIKAEILNLKDDNKDKDYTNILSSKLTDKTLLNPKIVSDVLEKANKKGNTFNLQNFVTKTKDGLSINKNMTDTDLKTVVDLIIEDDHTATIIYQANAQIANKVEGENATRSDLNSDKKAMYSIATQGDLALYLTSYIFAGSKKLDYVVSENDVTVNTEGNKINSIMEYKDRNFTEKNENIKSWKEQKNLVISKNEKISEKANLPTPIDPLKVDEIDKDIADIDTKLDPRFKGDNAMDIVDKGIIDNIKTEFDSVFSPLDNNDAEYNRFIDMSKINTYDQFNDKGNMDIYLNNLLTIKPTLKENVIFKTILKDDNSLKDYKLSKDEKSGEISINVDANSIILKPGCFMDKVAETEVTPTEVKKSAIADDIKEESIELEEIKVDNIVPDIEIKTDVANTQVANVANTQVADVANTQVADVTASGGAEVNEQEEVSTTKILETKLGDLGYKITYNTDGDMVFSSEDINKNISASSEDEATSRDNTEEKMIKIIEDMVGDKGNIIVNSKHFISGYGDFYKSEDKIKTSYVIKSGRIDKFLLDKLNKTNKADTIV